MHYAHATSSLLNKMRIRNEYIMRAMRDASGGAAKPIRYAANALHRVVVIVVA